MEFEKNAPTTAQDIARSEIPHMTVEPMHRSIEPEFIDAPSGITTEAKQGFSFEAESTAGLAAETKPHKSHHLKAITVAGLVLAIAIAAPLVFFQL